MSIAAGVEIGPCSIRHPQAPAFSSIVAFDRPPLAGGTEAHGGTVMPDPVAGLPPRFLRTPEAAPIVLDVRELNGTSQLWNLEGSPPSFLVRDGWSTKH
jgi:hypothetical protein